MFKIIRNVYAVALLMAAGALVSAPAIVHAQATIKCEKCTCNQNTGVCECTNCTIAPT